MNSTKISCDGWYSFLDGVAIAIFRYQGTLYFVCNDFISPLDELSAQMKFDGTRIYLHIIGNDVDINLEQTYTDISDDPTPFVEPEFYNFLLFINNVINSQERKALMLSNDF